MKLAGVAVLALMLGACRADEATPASAPAPAQAPAPAPQNDLCPSHGVLATLCTRCNPSLAVVFKSRGDWCAEHDLPESLCPICHPERQGRPAPERAAAVADEAPETGTILRMAHTGVSAQAGLTTALAETVNTIHTITAPLTIAYDAARVAEVNARLPALVEAIHVEIGRPVAIGAPLATLRSTALEAERARLGAARQKVRILADQRNRKRALLRDRLVAESELLDAELELANATAELRSLESGLTLVEADAAGRFTVSAPIEGIVVRRNLHLGRLVSADEPLFLVVDPSTVWAELDVPERELHALAVGQPVTVAIDALPDRSFAGETDYIAPEVDPRSRSVLVRVPLANPDRALRANMFGTATVELRDRAPATRIPVAAVQRIRGVDLVFVPTSPTTYETRRVVIERREGDHVALRSGLEPGERVVVDGSFLLKTELLRDSIGAGCCDSD